MKTRFYVSALMLLSLAIMSPAIAADNSKLPVCNTGTCGGTAVETFANKDIAGVKFPKNILHDTLGNPLTMPTAGADGASNTTTGLTTYNLPLVFNGTTWDRLRGDSTNGAFVNVKTSVLPTGAATSSNQSTANTALGAPGDTACATDNGSCSIEALIKRTNQNLTTLNTTAGGVVPDCGATPCTNTIGNVYLKSQYPAGAVIYSASATGTTAATTATLAGAASVTTYICGFSIRANATAAATGNATVTGTITGTLNFTQWTAPLASGLGVVEQIFTPCLPASAANTSIAVVSAAPGSGGTVSVTAWGYKL